MFSKILFYFFSKKVVITSAKEITLEEVRNGIEKAKLQKLKPKIEATEKTLISLFNKKPSIKAIFNSFKSFLVTSRINRNKTSKKNAA